MYDDGMDIIYLQVEDEDGEFAYDKEDVTWNTYQLYDTDIAYVRKTLADQALARAEASESRVAELESALAALVDAAEMRIDWDLFSKEQFARMYPADNDWEDKDIQEFFLSTTNEAARILRGGEDECN